MLFVNSNNLPWTKDWLSGRPKQRQRARQPRLGCSKKVSPLEPRRCRSFGSNSQNLRLRPRHPKRARVPPRRHLGRVIRCAPKSRTDTPIARARSRSMGPSISEASTIWWKLGGAKDPPGEADLAALKTKVDKKITSTRGLFVSIAGFRSETVAEFTRGVSSNIILMDGQDLSLILEGHIFAGRCLGDQDRKGPRKKGRSSSHLPTSSREGSGNGKLAAVGRDSLLGKDRARQLTDAQHGQVLSPRWKEESSQPSLRLTTHPIEYECCSYSESAVTMTYQAVTTSFRLAAREPTCTFRRRSGQND